VHRTQIDGSARSSDPEFGVAKERVAGLFDGIVAITATLLVLEIGTPDVDGPLTLPDLWASARSVMHWMVSFVMVAVIWTEFHFIFAHSRRWDGGLLILTFLQMALISLIPFAADLSGAYPSSLVATLVFAAIMGGNGLIVSANIYFLQQRPHLHSADRSPHRLHRRRRAQAVIYPLSTLISVVAAIVHDPMLGVLAWALCPLALAFHIRRSGQADARHTSTQEAAA